jgi:hypothetical protein
VVASEGSTRAFQIQPIRAYIIHVINQCSTISNYKKAIDVCLLQNIPKKKRTSLSRFGMPAPSIGKQGHSGLYVAVPMHSRAFLNPTSGQLKLHGPNPNRDLITHDIFTIALLRCFLTFFLIEPVAISHSTLAFTSHADLTTGDTAAAIGSALIPFFVSLYGIIAAVMSLCKSNVSTSDAKASAPGGIKTLALMIKRLSVSGLIFFIGVMAFSLWLSDREMRLRLIFAKILLVFSAADLGVLVYTILSSDDSSPPPAKTSNPCVVWMQSMSSVVEVVTFMILTEAGLFNHLSDTAVLAVGIPWCVLTVAGHVHLSFRIKQKVWTLNPAIAETAGKDSTDFERWSVVLYTAGQCIPYLMYYVYELN